jgi:hypothetical protein
MVVPLLLKPLLAPLLNSGDDAREDAARAILRACGGPRSATQLMQRTSSIRYHASRRAGRGGALSGVFPGGLERGLVAAG